MLGASRPALAVFGALLAAAFAAGQAQAKPPQAPDASATRAALTQYQERDQRLQNIGWRLVRGNAEFCDTVIPSIGLQLLDAAGYGGPDTVREALGLQGHFAVQSVANGSPAALSDAFRVKREVARIGEENPNQWPAQKRLDWERLTRAHDAIDAALAQNGQVAIGFADGAAAMLEPVSTCATRFEVMSGSKRAVAEGSRVIIGARFAGFEWGEDEIFAGVVAHELAHNLLHHRKWLERNGRKRRHVRLTEREADRMIPWLLANAGYDPTAAYRFMERWGKRHDLGLFRARTHDGWDERAEFIAAELPIIADLMEREGRADWSVHFRREIDPDKGLAQSQEAARGE
ncbi:MAG: hypothetical protein AAF291_10545 [Pseudomonadota bacterium]